MAREAPGSWASLPFRVRGFIDWKWPSDTLLLFNIAMENGPFIDDFLIKTSIYKGFSMAMLNNQRVDVNHDDLAIINHDDLAITLW